MATNETLHENVLSRTEDCKWVFASYLVISTRNRVNETTCPIKFEQRDKVELPEANPSYPHLCLQDGCETPVSPRDLAPPRRNRLTYVQLWGTDLVKSNIIDENIKYGFSLVPEPKKNADTNQRLPTVKNPQVQESPIPKQNGCRYHEFLLFGRPPVFAYQIPT